MTETKERTREHTTRKVVTPTKPKATVASVNKRIDEESVKKFLAYLEEGGGVWKKGHAGANTGSIGRPVNMATGKEYTGINVLNLSILSPYASNQWITGKQLADMSAKMAAAGVPPEKLPKLKLGPDGERPQATVGIFSKSSSYEKKVTDPKTGEEQTENRMSRMNAQFYVYNAEQIENCPVLAKGMTKEFEPIAAAELVGKSLIELTGLKVDHGRGNFYAPSTDTVHLLPRESFNSEYDFYSTANHEYVHSTLSAKRLNRTEAIGKRWGDEAYALEELRAEVGSLFLSIDLPGLTISDDHIKNHAAYVESWRKALSKDPAELMRAFSDADKCVNYIRGKVHEYADIHGLDPHIPAPRPEWTDAASAASRSAANSKAAVEPKIERPVEAEAGKHPKPSVRATRGAAAPALSL
jgi:antirestriction protein ArdC